MYDHASSMAVAGAMGFMLIVELVLLVILIVSMWMIFQKAGKPGWAAIIPIYNVIVLFEIVGLQWYWIFIFLVMFIPVIGGLVLLAFGFYLAYLLAKSFGKDVGFAVGLFLLSFIFYPILAFNKEITYQGPAVSPDNPFKFN